VIRSPVRGSSPQSFLTGFPLSRPIAMMPMQTPRITMVGIRASMGVPFVEDNGSFVSPMSLVDCGGDFKEKLKRAFSISPPALPIEPHLRVPGGRAFLEKIVTEFHPCKPGRVADHQEFDPLGLEFLETVRVDPII